MAARTDLSFILWQRTGNDLETMELLSRYISYFSLKEKSSLKTGKITWLCVDVHAWIGTVVGAILYLRFH